MYTYILIGYFIVVDKFIKESHILWKELKFNDEKDINNFLCDIKIECGEYITSVNKKYVASPLQNFTLLIEIDLNKLQKDYAGLYLIDPKAYINKIKDIINNYVARKL